MIRLAKVEDSEALIRHVLLLHVKDAAQLCGILGRAADAAHDTEQVAQLRFVGDSCGRTEYLDVLVVPQDRPIDAIDMPDVPGIPAQDTLVRIANVLEVIAGALLHDPCEEEEEEEEIADR